MTLCLPFTCFYSCLCYFPAMKLLFKYSARLPLAGFPSFFCGMWKGVGRQLGISSNHFSILRKDLKNSINNVVLFRLLYFSSVQSLSRVRLLATPWTAAHRASLSITNSWSLPKLMSIESVTPFNHLNLLLLPSIFPSMTVFSKESVLHMRWPKY